MKILVLSDSHGKLENFYTAISFFEDEISCIIHLGDFFQDAKKIEKKYSKIPIFYVAGNNDFLEDKTEKYVNIFGKKVFLTHGHRYNVYFGADKLFYKAKEMGADICLFGHTHNPFAEQSEGVFILNPGSISYPRALDKPTFAILEMEESQISAKFYTVYKNKIAQIKI